MPSQTWSYITSSFSGKWKFSWFNSMTIEELLKDTPFQVKESIITKLVTQDFIKHLIFITFLDSFLTMTVKILPPPYHYHHHHHHQSRYCSSVENPIHRTILQLVHLPIHLLLHVLQIQHNARSFLSQNLNFHFSKGNNTQGVLFF